MVFDDKTFIAKKIKLARKNAKITQKTLGLKKGDNVIIVGGSISGRSGSADTIRLETV